mgnify:CR=1 FL=1
MDGFEYFINTMADATARGQLPEMSTIYEKELRAILVGEQLLTPHVELVGKPGATIRIPFRDGHTYPTMYTESTSESIVEIGVESIWPQIPNTNPGVTFSFEDVTPTKFGHKDIITSDLLDMANWDVVADKQECLLIGMAEFRDQRIWNAILDATEVGTPGGAPATDWEDRGVLGPDPEEYLEVFDPTNPAYDPDATGLLEVEVSTANPVTYTVDYVQGYVKFVGTPGQTYIRYVYTTRTVVRTLTDTEMSYDDIRRANTQIEKAPNYGVPDVLIVDPYGMEKVARDDRLLDRDMLKTEVLLTGQVGKLAGNKVLQTHVLYENVGVVVQSKRIGYLVWKRKLQAKKEEILYTDGDLWIATWEKSIPFISRPNLIAVILSGQNNAYTKV